MANHEIVSGGKRSKQVVEGGNAHPRGWAIFNETHSVLALLIVLAVIGEMLILTFWEIPEKNKDLLGMLLGALNTVGFGVVIKFYFDSTKAAQIREQTADKAAVAAVEAVAAATASSAPPSPPEGSAQITVTPPADVTVTQKKPDEKEWIP